MEDKVFRCCICKKTATGYGHNPEGAAWKATDHKIEFFKSTTGAERCCDDCNYNYVIPGRLYLMKHGGR